MRRISLNQEVIGEQEMTRVLITGGAGYIGSVLTETLLSSGFDVTVVDLFFKPESTLSFAAQYRNFKTLANGCLGYRRLGPVISDHDVIIPLAALVGAPICNRHRFIAEKLNFESVDSIARCQARSASGLSEYK